MAQAAEILEVCMLGKTFRIPFTHNTRSESQGLEYDAALQASALLARTILRSVKSLPHLRLMITSEIPMGAGLGSSSAFSAAVAGVFCLCEYNRLDMVLIDACVMQAERVFHGVPSGLDQFTSINGGFVIRENGGFKRISVPFELEHFRIMIIDTGITRSTCTMVDKFGDAVGAESGQRQLGQLCELVTEGIDCICTGNVEPLAEAISVIPPPYPIMLVFRRYRLSLGA